MVREKKRWIKSRCEGATLKDIHEDLNDKPEHARNTNDERHCLKGSRGEDSAIEQKYRDLYACYRKGVSSHGSHENLLRS